MDSSSSTTVMSSTSSSTYSSSMATSAANGDARKSGTGSGRVTHVEDISDENLLREMWVEASDGESKRQIRARMYKLREERLKDFYNREGVLENILKEEAETPEGKVEKVDEKVERFDEKLNAMNGKSNGNGRANGNGNTIGNGNGTTKATKTGRISSKTTNASTTISAADTGSGEVTMTTTTTRATALQSGNGYKNKEGKEEGLRNKEKASVSRKQSQEQQHVKKTSVSMSSNSTSASVSRKNSENRSSDLRQTNLQKVSSSRNNNGNETHAELSRKSSKSGQNGAPTATTMTAAIATKVDTKKPSNEINKPPLVKRNSSSLQSAYSQTRTRTASGSGAGAGQGRKSVPVSRTSSSSTSNVAMNASSSVNTMKLVKGLQSPPVAKKVVTGTTPRFMSTTKSREIGIASTQQQFNVTRTLSNESTGKPKPKAVLTPKNSATGGRKSREMSPTPYANELKEKSGTKSPIKKKEAVKQKADAPIIRELDNLDNYLQERSEKGTTKSEKNKKTKVNENNSGVDSVEPMIIPSKATVLCENVTVGNFSEKADTCVARKSNTAMKIREMEIGTVKETKQTEQQKSETQTVAHKMQSKQEKFDADILSRPSVFDQKRRTDRTTVTKVAAKKTDAARNQREVDDDDDIDPLEPVRRRSRGLESPGAVLKAKSLFEGKAQEAAMDRASGAFATPSPVGASGFGVGRKAALFEARARGERGASISSASGAEGSMSESRGTPERLAKAIAAVAVATTEVTTTTPARQQSRRRSSAELLDSITDTEQLEAMLYEATDYDERSRIRARIRNLKRATNLGKGTTPTGTVSMTTTTTMSSTSASTKKSYVSRKSSEEIKGRIGRKSSGDGAGKSVAVVAVETKQARPASPRRRSSGQKEGGDCFERLYSTSTVSSAQMFATEPSHNNHQPAPKHKSPSPSVSPTPRPLSRKTSAVEKSAGSCNDCGGELPAQRLVEERNSSSPEPRQQPLLRRTPSVEKGNKARRESGEVMTLDQLKDIQSKLRENGSKTTAESEKTTKRAEATTSRVRKTSSKELKIPEDARLRKKSGEESVPSGRKESTTNCGRRPSNSGTTSIRRTTTPETNTNSVTSGYGVGPVDDDGTPLFGLRALRKSKQTEAARQEACSSEQTTVQKGVEPAGGAETGVDIRRSDLYGLRALRKTHDDHENDSERDHGNSNINDEAGPTSPPPASSPKSILKKTSSFSSNKSLTEMSPKPEAEPESESMDPQKLQAPAGVGIRSRSSSSDKDWKRKPDSNGGSAASNSMTNLASNALSGLSSFSRGRVGAASVREMSKRFERTETSVDGCGVASKAEHTTRHVLGGPADAEGAELLNAGEGGNLVYTKHSRIQKVELKDSESAEDAEDYADQCGEQVGGEVQLVRNPEDGTLVRVTKNTNTTKTRSFLSDRSQAAGLADVLERMKGEQGTGGEGGVEGGAAEEGRNLLNKFIGAQILLAGVEPLFKASAAGDDEPECRTTTTATMSHSLVINGVDVEHEADSDKLRRLLEGCAGAEERGRIEQRLKTLGSGTSETSKVVRSSSKQSSSAMSSSSTASADVTGELMPLILGQLQNSLQSQSSSKNVATGGAGAGGGSHASSLCKSNNNSTATLVAEIDTPAAAAEAGEGELGAPALTEDDDECLFDSGTESGEDAPPAQNASSTAITSAAAASSTNNQPTNPGTPAKGKKETSPGDPPSAEFSSFMEGVRYSLQQSASALVLSPTAASLVGVTIGRRGGKPFAIVGGGRTSATAAAKSTEEKHLVEKVDSVLSLLKDSLIEDPNYLDKLGAGSPPSRNVTAAGGGAAEGKGKELIALIDRLKSSLRQETGAGVGESQPLPVAEPKPPDLLLSASSTPPSTASADERDKMRSSTTEKKPPTSATATTASLADQVPWKIRAAKKRNHGRSRSIGVSQEELEEARRLLQEEAFRTALKSDDRGSRSEADGTRASSAASGGIPGFRPMSWRSDGRTGVETTATTDDESPFWSKFTPVKPHKYFRTFSLDNSRSEVTSDDYDPSSALFTPQEVAQIAIHRAAIKKQMSAEEDRRRRRNSVPGAAQGEEESTDCGGDGEVSSPGPRDFSLALPKPYANPNTTMQTSTTSSVTGKGRNFDNVQISLKELTTNMFPQLQIAITLNTNGGNSAVAGTAEGGGGDSGSAIQTPTPSASRAITMTPSSVTGSGSLKGNVSSGSSASSGGGGGGGRYKPKTERRRRMKRANTIDVPQPYGGGAEGGAGGGTDEEGDGDGEGTATEDDEPETPKARNTARTFFEQQNQTPAPPTPARGMFIPKTENDKKFYAFLERNSDPLLVQHGRPTSGQVGAAGRPLSHLALPDDHRTSHFSNLKTSFESNTSSQASSPALSPAPPLSPGASTGRPSSRPIWAKSDAVLPRSVRTKLQVFEQAAAAEASSVPTSAAGSPSPEDGRTGPPRPPKLGYQPQTKTSSLLAKKESFEKFVEEHTQVAQPRRPVAAPAPIPLTRAGKPRYLPRIATVPPTPTPEDDSYNSAPPLPPKAPVGGVGGVHIVHATKSAMDALARHRSNFSPIGGVSTDGSPPLIPPRGMHPVQHYKSPLPGSPTVERPIPQYPTTVPAPATTAAPGAVRASRELFESKQRDAVLTPVPHPPPTSHFNVTVPIAAQQAPSHTRHDLRSAGAAGVPSGFDEETPMTVRSPFIAIRKTSAGSVGRSMDSAGGGAGLHPKLAVFGVTRSIDDDRVVRGRLELAAEPRGPSIQNTAFAPITPTPFDRRSAFVARRFEGKPLEPLAVALPTSTGGAGIRRQSTPAEGSPQAQQLSPVVSKVMKGPQQQRATVTRREMSSLGADHPSAHRIRGDGVMAPHAVSQSQTQSGGATEADAARVNIKSILGQFQQAESSAPTQTGGIHKPSPNAVRVFPDGLAAPTRPLKKSHSGDALLQTHGPGRWGAATPYQGQGFVQARSRWLEAGSSNEGQAAPTKAPAPVASKSWVPHAFAGALGGGNPPSTSGPVIPRQRSLSHFPPSVAKPSSAGAPKMKPLGQSTQFGASTSSPSSMHSAGVPAPPRSRFSMPQQTQSLDRPVPVNATGSADAEASGVDVEPSPSVQELVEQLQRTASGSSIFDRTKSLYQSAQDAMGGGPKPKRRPPPSSLPKSRALFPKQYEANMSPEAAAAKQRELEAFFKGADPAPTPFQTQSKSKPGASAHYRKLRHQKSHEGTASESMTTPDGGGGGGYAARIRKSASQGKLEQHRQQRSGSVSEGEEDVDQIFESLFSSAAPRRRVETGKSGRSLTASATATESKRQEQQKSEAQCSQQQQASQSSVEGAGGAQRTVKQQSTKTSTSFKSASSSSSSTATASATASTSTLASPFSKFKQLDQQNSPKSGSSSGGGPMFKFTSEALKSGAGSAKDVLLYWCQCRVRDYQNVKIDNFSSSWSDGLAFCALIHHFYPQAFDYSKLDPKNRRHNFELAFRVAEEKADIYPLLDVEDMMVMGKRPDWKCVFTYVQSMYRKLKDM